MLWFVCDSYHLMFLTYIINNNYIINLLPTVLSMVQIVNSDVSNQYSIAYIGHGSGSPLHIGVSIGVIDIVDINSIHVSNHESKL